MNDKPGRYSSAEKRWSGVGPYYAMFPARFAEEVVLDNTKPNDIVFDPFAGRATSVFAAASNGRAGVGVEINPVGWTYAKAKLHAARRRDVERRLEEVASASVRYRTAAQQLPVFFSRCYTLRVRAFLLAARDMLNWRQRKTDWTLMALLLVHLHGKRTDSFSNQLRQTKSMSPPYAIRWWDERGLKPPEIDPVAFMKKKLDWRYARGTPSLTPSEVYLGDSVDRISQKAERINSFGNGRVKLLLTSPPYFGVTNYHYDQWLRLWLLGGPANPVAPMDSHRGKFLDRVKFRDMLASVFRQAAQLMHEDGVVYVRTDSRPLTREITRDVLREAFPDMQLRESKSPSPKRTQTELFGGNFDSKGEIDLVLRPKKPQKYVARAAVASGQS